MRWVVLLVCVASALVAAPAHGQAASSSSSAQPANALAAAELDKQMELLGHESIDQRRAGASALVAMGAGAVPAISQRLSEMRRSGVSGAYNVMRALLRERKESGDLVDLLVALKPDSGTQRALSIVCLLRASARVGTWVATKPMIPFASEAGGGFRPELTRQMKGLGDRSLAALIEARRDSAQETRAWALALLESMGKRAPGDAVQTNDNQVLADVLRAYANIKDLDALPVVLSFVNSDRVQVRTAAREATLAYGTDGTWRLREAYAVLTGEQTPDGLQAADLAKKLFDAYDHFRLQEVYALLESGLSKQRDGKLAGAVADFDKVLARQPMLDRRAEMAPAYAAWGESLEAEDRPAALDALRKALRLDEAGTRPSHVRSEILTLEGEDLVARGIADVQPFEDALALDPRNAHARASLDRLRADEQSSRARTVRVAAAAGLFVAAVGALFVVGGRRRKRAAA